MAHVADPMTTKGPWTDPRSAAEWVGEPYGRFLERLNRGDFDVLELGPLTFRVRERQIGEMYGMALPGPREVDLLHEDALKDDRVWERKAARRGQVGPPDFWLYRFYDAAGLLLYVGITKQCVGRFDAHGKTQSWWREVKTIEVEHFDTKAEVEARELELIRTSMPRYNKACNPLHPGVAGGPRNEAVYR